MSRVGIVSLTRKPVDFSVWINYHLNVVGVDVVFVQVEDTPSLEVEYRNHPRVLLYPYDRETEGNQYVDLQRRQGVFIQKILPIARSKGIRYLLHIDDDELLYISPRYHHRIAEFVHGLGLDSRTETDIHFHNLEALYPDEDKKSNQQRCFRATTFVHCQTGVCRSYANGKSMGKISDPHVQFNGPHHFTGAMFQVPKDEACILHFDSCTENRWRTKFQNLADNTSTEEITKIPFPYYRESIEAVRECPDCGEEVWKNWTQSSTERNPPSAKITIPHPGSTMMPGV